MHVGHLSLEGHPNYDPHHLFIGSVPYAVDQARSAAKNQAHSWRDFNVGAVVFAHNPETQETLLISAGNTKSSRHKTKVCAERKALVNARKAGMQEAIGIVVAATTNIDLIEEVTDAATPTLHPCAECQAFFNGHDLIRDDTIILTTGITSDTHQLHTHKEMTRMYTGKRKNPSVTVHGTTFDDWNETRLTLYDNLSFAERSLPVRQQRSGAKLAIMSMTGFAEQ